MAVATGSIPVAPTIASDHGWVGKACYGSKIRSFSTSPEVPVTNMIRQPRMGICQPTRRPIVTGGVTVFALGSAWIREVERHG